MSRYWPTKQMLEDKIEELQQQRDDLLAACELAVVELDTIMSTFQRLTGHQYNVVVNDTIMGRALLKAIKKAK